MRKIYSEKIVFLNNLKQDGSSYERNLTFSLHLLFCFYIHIEKNCSLWDKKIPRLHRCSLKLPRVLLQNVQFQSILFFYKRTGYRMSVGYLYSFDKYINIVTHKHIKPNQICIQSKKNVNYVIGYQSKSNNKQQSIRYYLHKIFWSWCIFKQSLNINNITL